MQSLSFVSSFEICLWWSSKGGFIVCLSFGLKKLLAGWCIQIKFPIASFSLGYFLGSWLLQSKFPIYSFILTPFSNLILSIIYHYILNNKVLSVYTSYLRRNLFINTLFKKIKQETLLLYKIYTIPHFPLFIKRKLLLYIYVDIKIDTNNLF